MISSTVTRIIWAIAPNAAVREAMLGDLEEEYQLRAERDGVPSATRWCWREAMRSLVDTLRHTVPSVSAVITSLLPAMLWGWLIATLATLAVMLLSVPLTQFLPFAANATLMAILVPVRLATSVMGGYEAAWVGKKAPLWSAVAVGVFPTVLAFIVLALTFVSPRMAHALILPALTDLLLVPCALLGGVLHQAQHQPRESSAT
jgi:hypothetical protein